MVNMSYYLVRENNSGNEIELELSKTTWKSAISIPLYQNSSWRIWEAYNSNKSDTKQTGSKNYKWIKATHPEC